MAEGGTTSTVIFSHSTFRSSAGVEMDGATDLEDMSAGGGRWSTHSELKTPMGKGDTNTAESLI